MKFVRFVVKPVVFVASLGPVVWMIWAGFTNNLGVNPLQEITHETGDWALRFLCLTLAVTPLRRLTGWNALIKFRRMAGLYAFFYGSLHFLIYIIADRFAALDFPDGIVALSTVRNLGVSVAADIYKRPFITVGFTAWLLMAPLAITSTAKMIRRLGGKRWNTLHKLVYASAVLGPLHYWWLVKADIHRPVIYGSIVAALLLTRVYWSRMKAGARASRPAPVRVARAESVTARFESVRPPSE